LPGGAGGTYAWAGALYIGGGLQRGLARRQNGELGEGLLRWGGLPVSRLVTLAETHSTHQGS